MNEFKHPSVKQQNLDTEFKAAILSLMPKHFL